MGAVALHDRAGDRQHRVERIGDLLGVRPPPFQRLGVEGVLDQRIETRERELASQAEQLRARIEELTRQLGEFDAESENLRITRKTLLTLPAPSPTSEPERPDIPDHPAYPQILTALADAGRPMRARDLCQALGLPILPKNTEGIRSKLKRLVSRGILTEAEPGLFTRPGA
ncbi:hypothetical protein [Streptomyces hirsutus]|uniref:hypothetical protein n=1 Tax=Streptomyces hirsutus TaxID=35620 RepID=UPI000A7FD664|nr:hypothetical protein [Streptomyces hirsutus]